MTTGPDTPGPVGLRRSRPAALAATVVGAVSAAAGAGVGIRYAVKTGLTGTSVLGSVLLVAGLALLGYAIIVAWRTIHGWWRLVLIPIALVVLQVMLAVGAGVAYSYTPRNALGASTPADRGLSYTDVTFRTSDGVRLSAWYVPSTNGAAVVLLPGAGSTRLATLGQAAALAGHGYGALLVDPRGQGRSGGRAMDLGWYGDRDVTAAVGFLQHRSGVDGRRIGVLGLSMGAEEAIGAAAADPAIRAVVAEGATTRTAADKAGWLPGGVTGGIERAADWVSYGIADVLSPAPQPRTLHSAIARAQGTPFLLITAGKVANETRAARYLRGAAPDRVQVWTVPGASHTHGLTTAPAEWTSRVTAFFDRAFAGAAR